MEIKLAEALLRRKELQDKVARLTAIKEKDIVEVKMKRKRVTDDVDDIIASVPKISMQQLTHAYDSAAKALRLVDAAIQQANWTTGIEVDRLVMDDYVDPYVKEETL
jgi:MoxR-like ATPase